MAEIAELEKASGREALLCCFESLKKPGQYCHRSMFAEWYRQHTKIEIAELGQTQKPDGQTARGKAGQLALL